MFTSSLSRAVPAAPPTPCVVPLEMTPDPLEAFASERPPAGRAPVTRAPVTAPPHASTAAPHARDRMGSLRVRVPAWIGASSAAVLAGAFSGLMIASVLNLQAISLPTFGGPGTVAAGASLVGAGGAVTITSEPPGVAVRVDGLGRGVTPFASMLAVGGHRIEIGDGPEAKVRYMQVRPGGDASLHVAWSSLAAASDGTRQTRTSAPSARVQQSTAAPRAPATPTGSLAVSSPFPVRVLVDGREVGASTAPRLLVPAGAHTVALVNERLEFEQVVSLEVAAGVTTRLAVEPPTGTLHLDAQPWAQVWIDGLRTGDTPIGNFTLPVGEHEVVLRHPDLGEQRRIVTVGARTPVHVDVEFTR